MPTKGKAKPEPTDSAEAVGIIIGDLVNSANETRRVLNRTLGLMERVTDNVSFLCTRVSAIEALHASALAHSPTSVDMLADSMPLSTQSRILANDLSIAQRQLSEAQVENNRNIELLGDVAKMFRRYRNLLYDIIGGKSIEVVVAAALYDDIEVAWDKIRQSRIR